MNKSLFLLSTLLAASAAMADNITFLDPHVKSVCVANWDTNGDGELSMEEAAAVTKLNSVFSFDGTMASFAELQYFTGLTSIATYDFYSCKNLTTIVLPPQITSINSSAFFGCYRLQEIVIPEAVKKISEYAFNGCSGLQSVTLSEGLTTIGDYAFSACSSLQGIAVPSTVTNIAASAFWSCPGLTTITVDEANTVYDSRDNCNGLIQTSTNTLLLGITTTVIPSTVTTIGPSAFYGNSRLQTITITEGVQTIDDSAFSGCTSLTTVILPTTLTSIGSNAFSGCKKLSLINFSSGLNTIGNAAFKGCTGLRKVLIPASVTKLNSNAFVECSRLLKVAVMHTTPITLSTTVFPYYKKATLYVPRGCRDAYLAANVWKSFYAIVELEDNTLTAAVEPEEMVTGQATALALSLDNDDFYSYRNLQMDIKLPEGFYLDANAVTPTDRCTGMDFTVEPLEENVYRLTCASEAATVTGTEGALFTIGLKAGTSVPSGDYQGIASDIVLTDEYGTPQALTGAEFSWNYTVAYPMGDVNHSGEVDIMDIVSIINYILDVATDNFHIDRADMDGDSVIDVIDLIMIIDTDLGVIPLRY